MSCVKSVVLIMEDHVDTLIGAFMPGGIRLNKIVAEYIKYDKIRDGGESTVQHNYKTRP